MIEVKNLTKWYGPNLAVDHVSFTIEPGHVYGFLGPNGAGKSTTMNMITGCLAASKGSVTVDGHDIFEEPIEAKRRIGYLPEIPPLYTDMSVLEYLTFVARAKRIARGEREEKLAAVMERTQITNVGDRLIRNLSKGYRQRVGIAEAILGDPAVVILDEPTVGLDPLQIIEIRDLIRELGRDHTVILSSHILGEISAVCDHVIMISRGRIVADDTLLHLTSGEGGNSLIKVESRGSADAIREALSDLPDLICLSVTPSGGSIRSEIELTPGVDRREDVFRAFARLDAPILSMTSGSVSLEDLFLKLADGAGADPVPEAAPSSDTAEEPQDGYEKLFDTKKEDES